MWIIENGGVGSAAVSAEEFYSKEKRALVGDFPRSRRLDGIFLYILHAACVGSNERPNSLHSMKDCAGRPAGWASCIF